MKKWIHKSAQNTSTVYASEWSGRITPKDVDDWSQTAFTKEQRKAIADEINGTDMYTAGYFRKNDFLQDASLRKLFENIAAELNLIRL